MAFVEKGAGESCGIAQLPPQLRPMKKLTGSALAVIALAFAAPAISTNLSTPMAVPLSRAVPDAADAPYPGGAMRLDIDAF